MNQFNNINLKNKDSKIFILIKKIILFSVTIIITFTVILNAHIVQEYEIVFVKNFGKIIRIIDKPGLYFKIPLLNNTYTIPKRTLYFEPQTIKVQTNDNKNPFLETFVLWRMRDPKIFIENLQSIANAEIMIENYVISNSKMKLITVDYNSIINNNDVLYKEISNIIRDELYSYGIEIIDIKSKHIYIPNENKEAIYARIKSEQEKIAAHYLSIGEKEALQIRTEADKEAQLILSEAEAKAERIKGAADAEAAKIYSNSYNKDPEFFRFMRTLEAYKKTLKNKPTIAIPIDSPFAKYLLGK